MGWDGMLVEGNVEYGSGEGAKGCEGRVGRGRD